MNDEQRKNIERVLLYEGNLLARCQDTVERARQLCETAVRLRADRSSRRVAAPH